MPSAVMGLDDREQALKTFQINYNIHLGSSLFFILYETKNDLNFFFLDSSSSKLYLESIAYISKNR